MIIDEAKAQAKAPHAALQAQGNVISHSPALELLARQLGAKDWNSLHARLALVSAPPELALGDRVHWRYSARLLPVGRLACRAAPRTGRLKSASTIRSMRYGSRVSRTYATRSGM